MSHLFISSKQVEHLCSIDEVVDFLHEIVQKDGLAQAEAEVPVTIKIIIVCQFESYIEQYSYWQ
jgi:hypothetical protein